MIQKLNKLLINTPLTRGMQRSVVSKLKRTLNVPDAYGDIRALIERTSPDAVLDIGSHIGGTIARMMEFSKLPMHGFEPTSASFGKLSKRFAGNSQVTLHNIALSNETGEATFHCNANEQTNSLLDNDQGNEEVLGEFTRHVGSETVKTVRLDEWMAENLAGKKVVIKSDVQGAEGLLLAGGEQTFRNNVIGFYSEAQISKMYDGQLDFCGLHEKLQELGFALHNIYPCYQDKTGRALQTDALWIKDSFLKS